MASKLSIYIGKKNDIEHPASKSPFIYSKDKFELQNPPPLVAFMVKTVRFLCRN